MPNTFCVKLGAALAATLALTVPAFAVADPTPGGLSFDDPTAPTVFPDGSTLTAPLGEMLGQVVRFQGSVAGAHPGEAVAVQRLEARGWVTAATAVVGSDGAFQTAWRPRHSGRTSVRLVPGDSSSATARSATDAGPTRAVTVYKPVTVTWYGPGFFGKKTACGVRLTKHLLGVAHRSLPCGTPVELYKDGRTITVPVVDRGPFRRGTTYDLTAATAQALGVSTTTRLGAVAGR